MRSKIDRRLRGIVILHEDPDVIVIEKAAGVLTQETWRPGAGRGGEYCVESALTDYVRKGQMRSSRRVWLVHRLDRETSGVMMVAKTPEVQDYFRTRWNEITEKTYLARVAGRLDAPEGVFEDWLEEGDDLRVRVVKGPNRGKLARTEWRVRAEEGATTLVEARLKSGRKNQIRVQFAAAGHPVVGDAKYGPRGPRAPRLCLHAWRLAFLHPHSGERLVFETHLPDFAAP